MSVRDTPKADRRRRRRGQGPDPGHRVRRARRGPRPRRLGRGPDHPLNPRRGRGEPSESCGRPVETIDPRRVTTMADNDPDETIERLNDLGHLSSGVGHHVINAFSAIVSNAELLRLKPPLPVAGRPGDPGRHDHPDGARGRDRRPPPDRLHPAGHLDRARPGGLRARRRSRSTAWSRRSSPRSRPTAPPASTGRPTWRRSRRSAATRSSSARCSAT